MAEIVLYMSNERLEALQQAMEEQGMSSVENYLQDHLIDLFTEIVPMAEQVRIQKRMDAERLHMETPQKLPEPAKTGNPKLRSKTRPLQAEEIVFEGDVYQFDRYLNFRLEPVPSISEMLGVPDNIWATDGLVNAYVNYNLDTEQPEDRLNAVLSADEKCSNTKEAYYSLSAEDLAALLPEMDAYCREQTGRSLSEYAAANRAAQSLEQERRPGKQHRNKGPAR